MDCAGPHQRAEVRPARAGLAASQQFGWPDQTDVFVVGSDGTLNVFWATGAGGWNGPQPISAQGFAPPGAYVAASEHFGVPGQTDVFVVGSDGALSVCWVDDYGTWNGPVPLSQPGFAPPGAPLAGVPADGRRL